MQYILRIALFFVVALANCLAQTGDCWPPLTQQPGIVALWAGTLAFCAVWITYEASRPLMSQSLKRRLGIVLAVLGWQGCLLGLLTLVFAGFNLMAASPTPADVIALQHEQAILFIAPSALLLASAVVSIWGGRNNGRQNDAKRFAIIFVWILASPLIVFFACPAAPVVIVPAAIMVGLLGAFALDATMDDMDNKWRETGSERAPRKIGKE